MKKQKILISALAALMFSSANVSAQDVYVDLSVLDSLGTDASVAPAPLFPVVSPEPQKVKKVVIQESAGYISKEYAYIYPPGIPLIVPGERISEGTVRQIIQYQQTGFDIQGTLEKGKIEVLDNG